MFMKVLCCILMLACYVVVYIQIRLEDNWYYSAIYEAEKIRYERACRGETMTRKEAIEILDEQHLTWTLKKAESYCMEVNEAIDMAIEALKEDPKTKVIAQINVDTDEIVKLIERNCNWKRPKGHWILRHVETAPKYVIEKFYCSECDEGQVYGMPNYCPNCGADMGRTKDD